LRLTHFVIKGLGIVKINRYSLPNILAGESIVPEFIQDDCTAPAIAAALPPPPRAVADMIDSRRPGHVVRNRHGLS
jgi:lipid-A-disaccharide synthase